MTGIESLPLIIVLAFILDAIIGDPAKQMHPVIVMGRIISSAENIFNTETSTRVRRKFFGTLLATALPIAVFIITTLVLALTYSFNAYLGFALSVALASTTLSAKGLKSAAKAVLKRLEDNDINGARTALSRIVGRDTENLDEAAIIKATVESTSENTSDGVVAPLFYMAIGGVPLAMAYKAVNTLDSMVGYKNDRYLDFGWASARLDDVLNYIPARLTAILMVISSALLRFNSYNAWKVLIRDGRRHPSPNAGYPEAATAGALGIELGGTSRYATITIDKPSIGNALRGAERYDIIRTVELMYLSSTIMIILAVLLMELIV